MDDRIGKGEIGREIAEQVEGERFRREQVRPESLVVEALVRLDERGPRTRGAQCGAAEQVRSGLQPIVEWQPAAYGADGHAGSRSVGLRPDLEPVTLTP